MSLQLPSQAAPPSNYPSAATSHDAVLDPAKGKAKGKAATTTRQRHKQSRTSQSPAYIPRRSTRNSGNDHRAFGTLGSSTTAEQDILEIQDIRRLEDMIQHCEVLLNNRSLCALIPGGRQSIEARHTLLQQRLDHLCSGRGLSHKLQDTSLDGIESGIKKDEDDADGLDDLGKLAISSKSSNIESSPTSSSSSSLRRTWKQDILNRASTNGKMTQLSLSESLELQEKESKKVQAERLAILKREEEQEKERIKQELGESKLSRGNKGGRAMIAVARKTVTFGSAADYNAATIAGEYGDDSDNEDDWDGKDSYQSDEEG